MATLEYNKYVQLPEETDPNGNVIKVRGMMIHPSFDGKSRGLCERITYNNKGVAIAWNYPRFTNQEIVQSGDHYVLTPVK